jgi:ribonuclease J
MRINIRRGAHQIGGTCIELEAQGRRLVLDIGVPLDAASADAAEMPTVAGFDKPDASLLGVVLSHPHLDHYGLAFHLPPTTTFLMGEASERILAAAAVFTPSGGTFEHVIHLADRRPISLGPFTITPFLMDHSAYDSYAVLIEADGQRVFYTGDLRGHGRKAALFERLVAHPPAAVDVLLMEGTTIQRQGTEHGFPTEDDIEDDLVRIFEATHGMPLVWCSGQNIDRLVSVFRATKRSRRCLILDMYTAHILAATGKPNLPQSHWKEVSVFLPFSQKMKIVQDKSFSIAEKYKPDRIYPEELAAAASRSVMLFRPNMRRDLEAANCLAGAELVYSMWDGYLKDEKQQEFLAWLQQHNIRPHKCHTSGHAPLCDLQRVRKAFGSAIAVPVHCAEPEIFATYFDNVALHADNETWEVK